MKLRNILLLSLLCTAFNGYAQKMASAETYKHAAPFPAPAEAVPDKATDEAPKTATYRYTVYGEIPVRHTTFEEEHYLGNAISPKWNTFLNNYTHEYDVEIGLSNSGTEFVKPSVYNAVTNANKYVKKAVKKGLMTREKAIGLMGHILDCANVICFESNTEVFEQAAQKAKSGEDAVNLFEQVELVNM